MGHADVRGIDVAVDIEIGDVAVAFLAYVICKPAYGQQIRRSIERDAILFAESLAGENSGSDWFQPLICDRQFAHLESIESFRRAKPLPPRPRTKGTIN